MRVAKCTPAIGAELLDLVLSSPPSPKCIDDIYTELMQSQVVFIRSANLTPNAHLEFARAFGTFSTSSIRWRSLLFFLENIRMFSCFYVCSHFSAPFTMISTRP